MYFISGKLIKNSPTQQMEKTMALSPLEAFLSQEERLQLIQIEKLVDELLADYTGGNNPIYFTHTPKGAEEPSIAVINALMDRYTKAGWGKVRHVNTMEGKGIVLVAY